MVGDHSFGQLVKTHRRELGLTQDELARRVGCAPVTLRKIEYDDLRPSVQIAERLAMALNIPLEERADFVRQARIERPPLFEVTPTPMPRPEEIGQEDLSGRAIRGYALGERIGKGGMGAVYRAVQPIVEREVAVKIILPQYANHPDFIRRFESEAQLVARLEHPHIVPLYDYWREPNTAFLVMRLLRGGSLQKLLEDGALPIEMTLRIMEQIGAALGTAHRVGVIHRDLKPANILLDEDQNAYLADFGIAKNLGSPNLEDMTQADMIIGSPNYISPEQIRSEFVRPQSDIYCLGVVLYEMLTGAVPFSGPTPIDIMHQHLSAALPPLAARKPGLPGSLDRVIEHATLKDPLARYADTESLLADLRRALQGGSGLTQLAAPDTSALPPLTAADNPYKGLRAFAEGDAADFFGREALVQQLLVRLGEGGDLSRFLAVVGPSGSGKSSVVKAGLIPALRRGALPGSENWYIVDLLPGAHPFEEIEAALLRIAVNPPESLLAQLQEDRRGLLRAVRRCLPEDRNIELVLVIDQFEELFTLVEEEATRALLLDNLVTAALDERSRVRFVLTLRADFTDRPLQYVDFGEVLRQRMEIVLPMTPDELEQAILRPAERVNLTLEPDLTAAIVRDVAGQPGTLPLMEYALTELFDQREGHRLTKAAYDEIGGVVGALGRRAEEVYSALGESAQSTARQLFLRLVTLGEGAEDTRRRVPRAELDSLQPPSGSPHLKSTDGGSASPLPIAAFRDGEGRGGVGVRSAIESFGKARLLAFDRDPITRGPTVEVAHEALLREWPRLRDWLANSREDVRMQRLLAAECAEWHRNGRDASFLLTGSRLTQFEGWATSSAVALTVDERAYLEASLLERSRQQEEEHLRQQRELDTALRGAEAAKKLANTQRQRSLVLSVGLVIAVILIGVAAWLYRAAKTNLGIANEQSQLSRSRELAAAAVSNLTKDPQLSLLLALEAVNTEHTGEAESALHQAVQASHLEKILTGSTAPAFSPGAILKMAYNTDGSLLATVNDQDWLQVFDIEQGSLLYTQHLEVELAAPKELTFFPENRLVIEAQALFVILEGNSGRELVRGRSQESGVKVTDSTAHQEMLWAEYERQGVENYTRVESTSQGVYLILYEQSKSTTYDGVSVWNINTRQKVFSFREERIAERYFTANLWPISPDGSLLAFPYDNGETEVWELASGKLRYTLSGMPLGALRSASFSPDGNLLVVIGTDNALKVWEMASGKEILSLNGMAAFFSSDSQKLIVTDANRQVNVWSVASNRQLYQFLCHPFQSASALSGNGKHLAAGGMDGTIHLCEVSPDYELRVFASDFSVKDVDYAAAQSLVGIASADNVVRLYDAESGDLRQTIPFSATSQLQHLSFTSDGKRILTTENNLLIYTDPGPLMRVWDVASGEELVRAYYGPTTPADAFFSLDGNKVFSNLYGFWCLEWDSFSLTPFAKPYWMDMVTINAVAYSPDTTHLALAKEDGWIGFFETPSQVRLKTTKLENEPLTLLYHPNGQQLAVGTRQGAVIILDAATGKQHLTLSGQYAAINALAYSPDGRLLVTGSDDGAVRLWDAESGQELLQLMRHESAITFLAFDQTGDRLVSSSEAGLVRVSVITLEDIYRLAQQRVKRGFSPAEIQSYHITPLAAAARVVFSPTSTPAKIAAPTPAPLPTPLPPKPIPELHTAITAATANQIVELSRVWTGNVNEVAWSPDGKTLAVVSTLGLSLLDARTLEEIWRHKEPSLFLKVAFSPDGNWIATGDDEGVVRLYGAANGEEAAVMTGHTRGVAGGVAFSLDGSLLASASPDDTVRLWRVPDGAPIGVLANEPYSKGVTALAFTRDGATLATGSMDGQIRFWDLANQQVVRTLKVSTWSVSSLGFSPDGVYLAKGSMDSPGRVIRMEDGADVFDLGKSWTFYSTIFSPDSSVAAAAWWKFDGIVSTVELWSNPEGRLLKSLDFNLDAFSLAFSPDGKLLAVGSLDGYVYLYGVPK